MEKLTAHQMELNPDAFAVRRAGTDLMTKAIQAVKRVRFDTINETAKFRIIDSISDEIYNLTQALETMQAEVDIIAGEFAPDKDE